MFLPPALPLQQMEVADKCLHKHTAKHCLLPVTGKNAQLMFVIKPGLKQFIIDLVTSNQLMTHPGIEGDQGEGSV